MEKNTFLNGLKEETNMTLTENGAKTYSSTLNKVFDMFATGGAYRKRSDNDCIILFKSAYEQDPELALKCLFYLRDIRRTDKVKDASLEYVTNGFVMNIQL